MRTTICAALFVVMLVYTGCDKGPGIRPAAEAGEEAAAVNVDPETGNLIAFWLVYPDNPEHYTQKEKPVLVTERYAVYLEWLDDVRRFYIYDNVTKQTFSTSDFEAFLKQLGSLPQDIAIQRFDTCCASRTYDMPAQAREWVREIMQSGSRKWAISAVTGWDHEIVCICESTGFRYPE